MSAVDAPEADVCAAIEQEIERWAKLRKAQGSKPPGCTPASWISYLFAGEHQASTQRAAFACRRLEKKGLVRRKQFDCGGNAWALTPKGSALAQEGRLWCRECAERPQADVDGLAELLTPPDPYRASLEETTVPSTYDKCEPCLVAMLEGLADDAKGTADHWREVADEHASYAHEYARRAAALKERAAQLAEAVAA